MDLNRTMLETVLEAAPGAASEETELEVNTCESGNVSVNVHIRATHPTLDNIYRWNERQAKDDSGRLPDYTVRKQPQSLN